MKAKVTLNIDGGIAEATDADAQAAGLNRSQYVERILRDAHYQRLLERADPQPPLPAADADGLRGLLAWQSRDIAA